MPLLPCRLGAVAVGLFIAAAPAPAAAADAPATDTQAWTELDMTKSLGTSTRATLQLVSRNGLNVSDPVLLAAGLTFDRQLSPHWSVSAGVLFAEVRSAASGRRADLWLPAFGVTGTWLVGRLTLSDRNRIERIIGVAGDPWRYRQRLALEYALAKAGPIRSIFLADEVFFDWGRGRWSRNRAQIGVNLKPVGRFAAQVYFLRQDDRLARPGAINVLGTTVKLAL